MLNGEVSASLIETSVREAITDILERSDRETASFSLQDNLMDTGLGSLDLAAVIALLERRLQVDPFLEVVPITEVRTVGELCKAYELCLAGAPSAEGEDELAEAIERARRRR